MGRYKDVNVLRYQNMQIAEDSVKFQQLFTFCQANLGEVDIHIAEGVGNGTSAEIL